MRIARAVSILSLFLVWILAQSACAETIELYPVDAATINGIPEDAGAENLPEPRVFLRFDFRTLPPGGNVDYAELAIGDVALPQNLPYVGLIVSRVLTNWNSDDISWDSPSADVDWENPGGDWDEIEFAYGAAGAGLMRPPFFNVTSDVRDWVAKDSAIPNYGLMLKPVDDLNTDVLVGIIDHTKLRPVLRVTYSEWE